MEQRRTSAVTNTDIREASLLTTHKVLRNTYMLLAATLLFSAGTAGIAMATNMPPLGLWVTLLTYFGLLFVTHKFSNSAFGIVCVFALTGFLGLTLGPMLSYYVTSVPNGSELIMTSLGLTGLIFVSLSAYAITTKKDFSFLAGFIIAGFVLIVGTWLLAMFGINYAPMQMVISGAIVILMTAFILYQTSAIIHGGETNYILATVGLYVTIYNLFTNLLFLLGLGDD